MHLAEIWRYPVKSMGGERLTEIAVEPLGLDGDRVVHVEDARGRIVTARTRPKLLGFHASLGNDGEPLIDGRRWTDPDIAAAVVTVAGAGTRLVRDESEQRFDILPLLVATDGAIAAFGYDGRRLRPNLVIGGVPGLEERNWEGQRLRVGDVIIELVDLRGRCVMTTFDPDTLAPDPNVLRSIVQRFDGTLALNARVISPGRVRQGDPVTRESTQGLQGLQGRARQHPRRDRDAGSAG